MATQKYWLLHKKLPIEISLKINNKKISCCIINCINGLTSRNKTSLLKDKGKALNAERCDAWQTVA